MNRSNRYQIVAEQYRNALREHAPDACNQLDALLVEAGNGWVCSDEIVDVNELMSAKDIAERHGYALHDVYNWAKYGGIEKHREAGRVKFRVGDILEYERSRC